MDPRQDEIPDLDTVFLVGAGIDENGWGPVLNAINEVRPEAQVGADTDAASYFFASHVYQRRFLEQSKGHPKIDPSVAASLIAQWTEFDLKLKENIARHLTEATERKVIGLRDEFVDIFNRREWGKRVVLTANWDMLLERSRCPSNAVLHIHGSVDDSSLLYLPSEVADEPFRTEEQRKQMGRLVSTMWRYIAKAPRLVIYGLSLSALDAELGYVLNVGLSEHLEGSPCEVLVYNCRDQVEKVERRVRMFLSNTAGVRIERRPLSC